MVGRLLRKLVKLKNWTGQTLSTYVHILFFLNMYKKTQKNPQK